MTKKLQECKNLVSFLGTILSDDYEVVLHWIDETGSFYIAAIEHPEISGRDLNSPVTGFALQLINDRVYEHRDFISNYKAKANVKTIQGSTFFIKDDDGSLLGLLCINFDSSQYVDLARKIASLAHLPFLTSLPDNTPEDASEVLHASLEEIINSVIDPSLRHPDVILTQEKKIELCRELNERGVFKVKGAIPKVAEALSVSQPSVYRYLKMIGA